MGIAAGSRLGPYEILAPLGAGGMGEVYRARDPRIEREVAIKVLPASVAFSSEHLRRFELEARATGALNHPNLLVVYDFGTHEGAPFLVSELLEGSTLRDLLIDGKLPIRKTLDYAVQIARGLAAAHEKGIVHRDLKPENIFITADDRVKLLDFGLAKLLTGDSPADSRAHTHQHATDPGTVLGTAAYMSPEQVRGATLDHRSDIFSFGIVVHEMATGVQPFRRGSSVETMNAILREDPAMSPEAMPPALARMLEHALEKSPPKRFESMKDVGFALDAISATGEAPAIRSRAKSKKTEPARELAYDRITYRRGFIMSARFAPDGSIVYGAAWEDQDLEVFSSHPGSPESRSLNLPNADVLAISPSGELALSLRRHYIGGYVTTGTLARMPLGGGAPRPVCDDVQEATWAPDGKTLVIIRRVEGMHRIEWPIGNVLYQNSHWINDLRVSPRGDRIAFIEHLVWGDDGGSVVVIDSKGHELVRSASNWKSTRGLAWSPKGDEVLCAAEGEGRGRDLIGISASGRERMVLAAPGRMSLHDVAPNGSVLLAFENGRRETVVGRVGEARQRNLSWFDWTWPCDLSRDGKTILFEEQGSAARGVNLLYIRPTDGGPAVRVAEGRARGKPFSADGKWFVAETIRTGHLELWPVGMGQPREIPTGDLEVLAWQFFPDGRRLAVLAHESSQPMRLYELSLDGETKPRMLSTLVAGWPVLLSTDGATIATVAAGDKAMLVSVENGEARPAPGFTEGDVPIGWTADDAALYVYRRGRLNLAIDRIDVTTGERSTWNTISPADPAGILDIMPVFITPDGQTYAYGYRRFLSDLFVVTGLV